MLVNYQVYEISGNSNGGLFCKRGEHKNVIPFCVLLSFLDCIHTDSEVQRGATLFKITLKVELLSCFDGKPKTRAGEKIIAVENVIWLGNLQWCIFIRKRKSGFLSEVFVF